MRVRLEGGLVSTEPIQATVEAMSSGENNSTFCDLRFHSKYVSPREGSRGAILHSHTNYNIDPPAERAEGRRLGCHFFYGSCHDFTGCG
ncbi:hypothetical protein BaRGS_00023903 [Batillaria attramentaria]|uniref:Uncharacterized protein n=1 Tax=Batillaria attramentaria TaxID=370345 RepID=A0ABD0KCN1_9CAEN